MYRSIHYINIQASVESTVHIGSPKRLAHIGVDRLCHAACLDTLGPLHITRKGQLLRAAATARLYLYMPHSCHTSDSNCNWRVSLQTVFHLRLKKKMKKQLRNVKMKMK